MQIFKTKIHLWVLAGIYRNTEHKNWNQFIYIDATTY